MRYDLHRRFRSIAKDVAAVRRTAEQENNTLAIRAFFDGGADGSSATTTLAALEALPPCRDRDDLIVACREMIAGGF